MPSEYVKDVTTPIFYLCGLAAIAKAVRNPLDSAGADGEDIGVGTGGATGNDIE